ncbi:MAG: ferrous iron transport protein A [Pseudomonadales bacterium]|nr:ferrous iron transport protein A [Pseudomonadales bacterium]
MSQFQVLSEIPAGQPVMLSNIEDSQLSRRLLCMGIPPGVELEIFHNRKGSVVVGRNSLRVALGEKVASKIGVTPVDG